MALKLSPKNEITLPVIVYELQDGNKMDQCNINVTYVRLKRDAFQEKLKLITDENDSYSWSDMLKECVKNISPIQDDAGNEVDFSESVLDDILDYQPAFDAVLDGFITLNSAAKEAERRKNSKKQGGTGR